MYTPLDWWMDYSVWLMLQYKFMLPAQMVSVNDDMQEFLKYFNLTVSQVSNLCQA